MGGDTAEHWQDVYEARRSDEVSWFERRPARSLELIARAGLPRNAAIVDVGGGGSRLAAELVTAGYRDVTVADFAASALQRAREVAGEAAAGITFLEADVTAGFERRYDLWHDRAVLHFMVDPDAREAYLRTLRDALPAGGWAVIASFGPEGPTSCSGLPVARYSAAALAELLGPDFEPVHALTHIHTTPGAAEQQFVYALFARKTTS